MADHDPFSLGDSEDEREKEAKGKDLRTEDSERLKKMASTSESGHSGSMDLGKQEKTGPNATKDKDAEEMLAGKQSS